MTGRRKYRDQSFETPIPLPGVSCNPQNMAQLAGAQHLLAVVVQALTERVDRLEKRVAA